MTKRTRTDLEATIKLRASSLGSFYECKHQAYLHYVHKDDDVESDAMRIGTNVHTLAIAKLSDGLVDTTDFTEQDWKDTELLRKPADFPIVDYSRGSFICSNVRDLEKLELLVDGNEKVTIHHGGCPYKLLEIAADSDLYDAYELPKGEIQIQSTTRGADSMVETLCESIKGRATKETTIEQAIHRNMFSRPLSCFEQRSEKDCIVYVGNKRYKAIISGQFDAAGPGIICDIKTAKQTPNLDDPTSFLKYVVQQAVYGVLNDIKDLRVVLLYIVKTKRPRLVPVSFTFRRDMQKPVMDLLRAYVKMLVGKDKSLLHRSFGTHCKWCFFREECVADFDFLPNILKDVDIIPSEFEF